MRNPYCSAFDSSKYIAFGDKTHAKDMVVPNSDITNAIANFMYTTAPNVYYYFGF